MGETLENVSKGMDTYSYKVPLGVCAGIAPFNFPAMIPLWMFPVALVAGHSPPPPPLTITLYCAPSLGQPRSHRIRQHLRHETL